MDNSLTLYIDGVLQTSLPHCSNWQIADSVPLPDRARSIAVHGYDLGVVAGILASSDDDSLLSNSNWKCTNVFYDNWMDADFDDSSWPSATPICANGEGVWVWSMVLVEMHTGSGHRITYRLQPTGIDQSIADSTLVKRNVLFTRKHFPCNAFSH